jgi:type I restriction enzyme, S subunit
MKQPPTARAAEEKFGKEDGGMEMKTTARSHVSDWKLVRLGDVFTQRKQKGAAGLPVLSVTMDQGIVERDTMERKMAASLPPEESLLVQPGDLVYNTMRMWQGAVGFSDRVGVVSPAYVVCRPNTDLVDGQFMHCLFKSHEGRSKLQAFSHGLTEDRLRLYFDDFAEIPFRLPPLPEQKRIADILKGIPH